MVLLRVANKRDKNANYPKRFARGDRKIANKE
jgi:hypothetical protein